MRISNRTKTMTEKITNYLDGHKGIEIAFPTAKFYNCPKWLNKRCREYRKTKRRRWTDTRGKIRFLDPWPERYMHEESGEVMQLFPNLFDHWGKLTLPDGRIALHASPYCPARKEAESFADILGIELLSSPGELSRYGHGTFWFLFAEPIITKL